MSSSNLITDKCQQALRAFLRARTFAAIPAEQIYKGIENPTRAEDEAAPATRKLPCVEAICQDANTVDEHFLNWLADARVVVRTNADDTTEDEHHATAAAVFNTVTTDTIAADLTAALDDFTAFLVNFKGQSWELVERSWQSTLSFEIHCCGSKITEPLLKTPVRVACTTNLNLSATPPGTVIDGVSVVHGNRILLTGQTLPAENGIYTVGTGASPARASDADNDEDFTAEFRVQASSGTANAGLWRLTSPVPLVVGVDDIAFIRTSQ